MGPINLLLWGAGVVLVVIGYTRARGPWARYQALKAEDANIARYESWRGGVAQSRDDRRVGGDVDASPAGPGGRRHRDRRGRAHLPGLPHPLTARAVTD